MFDRESLLRKAKALLELARNNDNEHQALAASEKVLAMAAKYSIDLEALANEAGFELEDYAHLGKYNETWRITCYRSAAEMFMCNHYFSPRPHSKEARIVHHIVGAKHNVAVALEIGKYFETTINRLANDAARINNAAAGGHTHRHRYIRTFRLSAAERLAQRVREFIRKAKNGQLTDEAGSQLPAMMSLYQQANDQFAEWCKKNNKVFSTHAAKDRAMSSAARSAGAAAGDKISLSTQIGAKSSTFALPSS